MAIFASVFPFGTSKPTKIAALGAGAASSEQAVGKKVMFAIVASVAVQITFGPAGFAGATADAAGFLIPANTIVTMDSGQWDSFKVFNNTGGAGDIYWIQLSRI